MINSCPLFVNTNTKNQGRFPYFVMSSAHGIKGSLVNIQAIIDGELRGSISDGDYLSLVNVIKSVYDKNVRTTEDSDEDVSLDTRTQAQARAQIDIDLEQTTACLTIQNMWRDFKNKKKISRDWIDKERENIFGKLFDEDERAWSLQYLEWSWKNMYRKHYDLGLFSTIPGDKISLSYRDFVSLSRGTH